jgi:hypothetical protein
MAQEKESFISSEQRPAVGLKPDTPISELRVRDLQTLLQGAFGSKLKFNEKYEKNEKMEGKEDEWKNIKDLKSEKYEKNEKMEGKNETKDLGKNEKLEYETGSLGGKPPKENETFQPGGETVSPAAIDQLIQTISGLSEQVTTLTQEVEKLRQRSAGG